MKKILLGTTALVTAGLLAGPALASDPLKVTVGGNVVTGFYVIDADNIGSTSFQDTKVALVARNIDIKAEGTLDNGLVAGVDAKLQLANDWNPVVINAAQQAATFRQLFAYLEGGFGRFEIGGTDGAAYKMHYTSPWFVPGNGVDSPNILNAVASTASVITSTFSLMATDANKISYFTPRLAGFQLGVSYTPDATVNGPSANGTTVNPKDAVSLLGTNNINRVFEVAANYAGTLSGVDLGVDGFYTKGDAANVSADPEEYGFGANIGYAGFTLGGAWYRSHDLNPYSLSFGPFSATPVTLAQADIGRDTWTIGLKYATGPWTVGAAYLNSEDRGAAKSGTEAKTFQVGGGYNLGSGVDLGLDLQYTKNQGASGAPTYDTKSAGLVLAIAF